MKLHESNEYTVILPGARVVGDVTFGPGCSVWYNAVLRGDQDPIRMGANCNVQDNAIFHGDVVMGDGCTVGHGAIVHGCTVGSNVLVGMGAIILNDAVIGDNCIIAAGTLVTERTVIPPGSMVMGVPGRVKRSLTEEEIEGIRKDCEHYLKLKELHR